MKTLLACITILILVGGCALDMPRARYYDGDSDAPHTELLDTETGISLHVVKIATGGVVTGYDKQREIYVSIYPSGDYFDEKLQALKVANFHGEVKKTVVFSSGQHYVVDNLGGDLVRADTLGIIPPVFSPHIRLIFHR